MMGKLGGKATDTWACSNDNIMHDVFISYRQEQQQQQIVLTLSRALEQHYGVVSPIHTFVDVKCLRVGEDWSAGFMKGLANSRMVLLMCSEVALEKVLESDKKPDNMFLEWEMALSRATAKSPVVVPVFLGKLGEDKTITPFRNFSVERFPDTVPCHSKSLKNRTVREIMADVYRLQGIRASDIEYIERIVPELLKLLRQVIYSEKPTLPPGQDPSTNRQDPVLRWDVYVSYCQSDYTAFARLIVATLKEQQFSVWVDFEQMIGNVYEQMADGIAGSRVFLPIISVNYETRVNCRKELCYAADMKRPMVPLRLVKWGQTPLCDLLTTAMVSIDVTGGYYDRLSKEKIDQLSRLVRGGLESYHPTKK